MFLILYSQIAFAQEDIDLKQVKYAVEKCQTFREFLGSKQWFFNQDLDTLKVGDSLILRSKEGLNDFNFKRKRTNSNDYKLILKEKGGKNVGDFGLYYVNEEDVFILDMNIKRHNMSFVIVKYNQDVIHSFTNTHMYSY